jgi:thiol:disulfide interchange protein DsbC
MRSFDGQSLEPGSSQVSMKSKLLLSALGLALLLATSVRANESAVRQAFLAKFPKATVESVTKTPFAGIYEVVLDGQIFYTDEKATYVFSGSLIDMRGRDPRNLTQETSNKLASSALAKATDLAVKRVRGNGKRVIYTFEDPNCGYCKELQKELQKVNDVTIYTFLWPILSQDSIDKSKAIWCSKDRAKAWEEYMLKGVTPTAKRDCDTSAIEKNQRLAQRFNLKGTPAVYLGSGEQVGGFMPASQLEAALGSPR